MPGKLSKLNDWIARRFRGMRAAGASASFSLLRYAIKDRLGGRRSVPMRTRFAAHPLQSRTGASDGKVFYQVFARLEYACVDDIRDVKLIIDCGANVGYSSAYFLSRFPGATLIAVEPDPGNFQMLQQNLAPYGDRVRLVQSGVWSDTCGLVISEQKFGDGREWAIQVRESRPGETPQMMAVDIGSLLRESGEERISILKVDIERAETVVFAKNYESWIGRVDNLIIELHDDECRRIFFRAIEGLPFDISESGELTVCKRRREPAAGTAGTSKHMAQMGANG